jgi:hypothetical protein
MQVSSRPIRHPGGGLSRPQSSTGLLGGSTYFHGVYIRCLDPFERLPFNYVIQGDLGYKEFRTLYAAKKFIRSL